MICECIVVQTNGLVYKKRIPLGTFKHVYDIIGCSIVQSIAIDIDGMVCNALMDEEGKINGQKENPVATTLIGPFLLPGDYIVGTVVLAGPTSDGEYTDVPDAMFKFVSRLSALAGGSKK